MLTKRMAGAGFFLALAGALVIGGCGKSSAPPAGSSAADAPSGYSVAASTDTGESLVAVKQNVATVDAALLATFGDFAHFFDGRPTIGSAYQDAHDSTSGGATFSANLKGKAIRGIVSCKLHDGGASVGVIFVQTGAPKADLEKLIKPPAVSTPAVSTSAAQSQKPLPGGAAPAAGGAGNADVALSEYDYPDGTGSVGVASGWTAQCQSAMDTLIIKGPADQGILMHTGVTVYAPDSMIARQRQQSLNMQAQNARNGFNVPPPKLPPLMIGEFTDPVTAVQNLMPQFSQRSEGNGGPSLAMDRMTASQELPCPLKGGKCAQVTYALTRTKDGQSGKFRVQVVLMTAPLSGGPQAWMYFARYSAQAPDATFDHDLPIMMAMVNSEKLNKDRVMQVAAARNQQMQQASQAMAQAADAQRQASYQMFQQNQQTQADIHQQQMQANQQQYDAHNQQFKTNEWQRSRNAADFNESIIGTRTIYDTVTGASGYANLTDATGVVDALNQAALDPNRFVQIPLRDQLYPTPP